MRGTEADGRQHFAAQPGYGEFRAVDPLLHQHLRVVDGGIAPGLDQGVDVLDLRHANAGTFMRRLDDQREAQLSGGLAAVLLAGQHRVARRRQAEADPQLLGPQLVHRQGRSQDTAAGVGDFQALQQALHAAVFTATAVEDDEGAVDLFRLQTLQQVVTDIDAESVHAGGLQGLQHHRAGVQRNLALGALAAVEHGDPAERCRFEGGFEVRTHFVFLLASA
ncbi:hypothetical protein D9M71_456890 [compost metagenome]